MIGEPVKEGNACYKRQINHLTEMFGTLRLVSSCCGLFKLHLSLNTRSSWQSIVPFGLGESFKTGWGSSLWVTG